MKKVVITGSTGMVGSLVLGSCLRNDEISEVISLVRKPTTLVHPKYKELVVDDFLNYDKYVNFFNEVDIIFYCLGVYTGALPADAFRKVNYDYPLNLAKAIYISSPKATFCLLSGQGADRTEKSKMQFARDKGAIENALSAMQFRSFYSFRPGYIYPTNKRQEPNFFYTLSRFLYPIIKLLGNNLSITDKQLAATIFLVGMNGYSKEILENADMRALNL
jgi:nucleoside-diphosphate-sugar epimerase